MAINQLSISYPDFQLNTTIDPEQFDINFNEIVTKINSILSTLHSTIDGQSGADEIFVTPYGTLTKSTIQGIIEELEDRVSVAKTKSDSALILSTNANSKADIAIVDSANSVSVANSADVKATNALSKATNVETSYNLLKPQMEQAVLDVANKVNLSTLDFKIAGAVVGAVPTGSLNETFMSADMKKDIVGGVTSYNAFQTEKTSKDNAISAINTVIAGLTSTATGTSVVDSGGFYTSTTVEGALSEIGQTMNAMRGNLITTTNALLNM